MTPALEALCVALADVDKLLEHHPKSADPTRGKPSTDEGPLMRSAVVLIYAAWEVYVESSLEWLVKELITSDSPDQLPSALREFVVKQSKTKTDPWRLAADGWKDSVLYDVHVLLYGDEEEKFGLNSASYLKVSQLHKDLLGARPLDACSWPKKPNSSVRDSLESFMSLRGEIAHTGRTTDALHLSHVRKHRGFIERLAQKLDQKLEEIRSNNLF